MRNALIAALVLSAPAIAGDKDGQAPAIERVKKQMAAKDQDGDGKLSAAELGAKEEMFKRLDADGDGFVTAEELLARGKRGKAGKAGKRGDDSARVREIASAYMNKLDRDGDGRLSAAELEKAGGRIDMAQADANGDGGVDLFELTVMLTKARERGRGAMQQRLKRMDANQDGAIDKQEWQGPDEAFARFDADGDGKITMVELKKAGRGGGGPGAQMMQRLKKLDANGNGILEKAEWKGPAEVFARLDANQDGQVTEDEMKHAGKQARGRWNNRAGETLMRRFDGDQDGKIAADEWKMRPELFQRLDANSDGFLTRDELAPRGPDRMRKRKGDWADLRSGKDSASFLQKFDRNGDGQVSKDEFKHERRFAEIDANSDGTLSRTEIEDSMDKRAAEKGYGLMERFDLNGDRKITREEFTGPAATFEKLDKNHDGVIDAADTPSK